MRLKIKKTIIINTLNTKMKKLIFSLMMIASLALTGCVSDNNSEPTNPKQDEAQTFDFATTKTVNLNVNYNVSSSSAIMFKVYSEDPYKADANGKVTFDSSVNAIASGFTSDNGKYSKNIVIPAAVSEVYVYTYYLGAAKLMKAEVSGNTVTLDSKTNAVDCLGNAYTDVESVASQTSARTLSTAAEMGYKTWLSWNNYGRISSSYVTSVGDGFNSYDLYNVSKVLQAGENHEKYALSTDFYVSKDANVVLRYLGSDAADNSTMGFYCYKGTTAPTDPNDLIKVIAFPSTAENEYYSVGAYSGEAIQLEFWDETTSKWSKVFPAGYTIGFFLADNGFAYAKKGGSFSEGYGVRYSTTKYNTDGKTHTAAFDMKQTNGSNVRVLSFEDRAANEADFDYNDVVFTITSNPIDALGPVPEVDPSKDEVTTVTNYKGILAYEDLWPNKGDFDLNDVVVKYNSDITIGSNDNGVIKTVDTYTLMFTGAEYDNNFCVELPGVKASDIESCVVTGANAGKGLLNPGSSNNAVIEVFENAKSLIGRNIHKEMSFTVTTTFKNRPTSLTAPYNPFIVPGITTYEEVHLVNYTPSSLFTNAASILGTHDDLSVPSEGKYYITSGMYPFAIHMPNVTDLGDFLDGSKYETKAINVAFPKYIGWVTSEGQENKDWYNYPVGK
jgi:LruC domain-containing protein